MKEYWDFVVHPKTSAVGRESYCSIKDTHRAGTRQGCFFFFFFTVKEKQAASLGGNF